VRRSDLVLHLPLRYEDETRLTSIGDLTVGRPALVEGLIERAEVVHRGRRMFVARLCADGDTLFIRLLSFYPSQVAALRPGQRVRVYGEPRGGLFGLEMVHPRIQVLKGEVRLPDSLTPIYSVVAGIGQARMRRLVGDALARADLSDSLPPSVLSRLGLPAFADSVRLLHRPPAGLDMSALDGRSHPAWQRVLFDELLAQQLAMRVARVRRKGHLSPAIAGPGPIFEGVVSALPFRLTGAQAAALSELRGDLARPQPMQRLLQGDVGSGKTVVAVLAAALVLDSGYQVAFMAPTELLAEQHHRRLVGLLGVTDVRIGWLSGSLTERSKARVRARIATGDVQVAVGTHALFQDGVAFHRLGLVIIDEQHRFGVRQRQRLRAKGSGEDWVPHHLMMSATPIPRTLSMSYMADLDVTVIGELPPGRTPVLTKFVAEERRWEVEQRVRSACAAGAQAYWVCPLIGESEQLPLQAALELHDRLSATFPELKVALAHGRMSASEKAGVMERFQSGEVQLLVATTVVEVGVDVPNATIMVIEHAERLGLAQLHQLRGRVGRGSRESVCVLLYRRPLSEGARERLKVIHESHDGFEIARRDLLFRGPGEYLGERQSGAPLLRFADPERDFALLEQARDLAEALLQHEPARVEQHLSRWSAYREFYLPG
jgi:ATP-dependent DNA helicase RecG